MPTITVTATLSGVTVDPRTPPSYEWSATLAFDGGVAPTRTAYGAGRRTQHAAIAPQVGPNNSWRVPFTQVRGGLLTISVVVRIGTTTLRANSENLTIVGTNPTANEIRTFANGIGANKVRFRKKMRQESSLQQFRTPGLWPKYSSDGLGGVGLCQLTRPAPTQDQTWNWQENVRGGWNLYLEKERIARAYPRNVRQGDRFRNLVTAWNNARAAQGLARIPVDLPDYTDEQLELDTLRGFNGYAGGLHEYRVRVDAQGRLVVTVNAAGTRGSAEWERVPVADRPAVGDPNYVNNVEAQPDF